MVNFQKNFSALMILLVLAQPLQSQQPIDRFLGKEYLQISMDNLNEVLKALGVSIFSRLATLTAKPLDSLNKYGEQYVYLSQSLFSDVKEVFKPNEPFTYLSFDGRNVTAVITINRTTLHEAQTEDSRRKITIDRKFNNKELKVVIKYGKIVAKGVYQAIKTKRMHKKTKKS